MKSLLASIVFFVGISGAVAADKGPVSYPLEIDPECRGGLAKLFDECSDQFSVLKDAAAYAERSGKVLLVGYGAEWCIWCHVLHNYLAGVYTIHPLEFEHTDGPISTRLIESSGKNQKADALRLEEYASSTFVLVHIEDRYAPNGWDVMEALDAAPAFHGGLPFTFAVSNGRYLGHLPSSRERPEIEVRREGQNWFRGYDRAILLEELRRLESLARQE